MYNGSRYIAYVLHIIFVRLYFFCGWAISVFIHLKPTSLIRVFIKYTNLFVRCFIATRVKPFDCNIVLFVLP